MTSAAHTDDQQLKKRALELLYAEQYREFSGMFDREEMDRARILQHKEYARLGRDYAISVSGGTDADPMKFWMLPVKITIPGLAMQDWFNDLLIGDFPVWELK